MLQKPFMKRHWAKAEIFKKVVFKYEKINENEVLK